MCDKILRGTKPNALPVGQTTKFDLFLNPTKAKALGLTLPPLLVALASDVIEWTIKCPLLAQSGHAELRCTCPLSGVKPTSRCRRARCQSLNFFKDLIGRLHGGYIAASSLPSR